ncbi:hypothetical protein [Streptomyces virginiae]|uniref:hypothetical protein n=1 Tax=Streptomyces virginiae TaxID=1961 RepID=UPI003420956D
MAVALLRERLLSDQFGHAVDGGEPGVEQVGVGDRDALPKPKSINASACDLVEQTAPVHPLTRQVFSAPERPSPNSKLGPAVSRWSSSTSAAISHPPSVTCTTAFPAASWA